MKITFVMGSHPRHYHIAKKIFEAGFLSRILIETRENMLPIRPSDLSQNIAELYDEHFVGRERAEQRHFGSPTKLQVETKVIEKNELNSTEVIDYINEANTDLILSYGVHKFTNETLGTLNAKYKWNIHGGLSPWYRGVLTHFWPTYMLEPQMIGMTIHELTEAIDGGDVVHQVAAELIRGDGIHDTACRAVLALGEEISKLLKIVSEGGYRGSMKHKTSGRIWRAIDWRPEHLKQIYTLYDNKIVDRYIDGEFANSKPNLYRQF